MTIKKSNCDQTKTVRKIKDSKWYKKVTKLLKKKHSNCDKAQKLQLWQNLKIQIATNSTQIVKKKNAKIPICDKTYIMTELQTQKF